MHLLTKTESQELQEHFASRHDCWKKHNGAWIRRAKLFHGHKGSDIYESSEWQYVLGLRFREGLPHEFVAMSASPLAWSRETAESYVDWLLSHYTQYALRQRAVVLLKSNKSPELLSKEVLELLWEAPVRLCAEPRRKHSEVELQAVGRIVDIASTHGFFPFRFDDEHYGERLPLRGLLDTLDAAADLLQGRKADLWAQSQQA